MISKTVLLPFLNVATRSLEDIGALALFSWKVFKTWLTTKGNFKPILEQVNEVTFRSLGTVIFSGIFVGAILVIQFYLMLSRYDAAVLLGGLNTSAIVREVGPLIISFLIAGKIGAFTAAELGTMRVTEQIDAIECLGTNPIQYLVLPRFAGIVFSSVLLLAIGLMVSILGAMGVATVLYGINPLQYASSMERFTGPWTIFSGAFKCVIYAFIVACVCCYRGYHASGGASGVGRAVTYAAVFTNFYIVIANYVSSHILEILHDWILLAGALIKRGML